MRFLLATGSYVYTFRILHVVSALGWYGSALTFAYVIEPTASALGAQAGPFMDYTISAERHQS
ncbi:MAG TPA: hypothetical protein VEQ37_19545 [Actinomycetota bacterium]|nr:hypothetical protein [Actinomycetota bacterium]